MSDLTEKVERLVTAVERALHRLDAQAGDVVLTRDESARQLKVSVRQLRRLVASGRIAALPSGIARAELERYARTPAAPLPKAMTRPMAERSAQNEADRLTELLKARRKRR